MLSFFLFLIYNFNLVLSVGWKLQSRNCVSLFLFVLFFFQLEIINSIASNFQMNPLKSTTQAVVAQPKPLCMLDAKSYISHTFPQAVRPSPAPPVSQQCRGRGQLHASHLLTLTADPCWVRPVFRMHGSLETYHCRIHLFFQPHCFWLWHLIFHHIFWVAYFSLALICPSCCCDWSAQFSRRSHPSYCPSCILACLVWLP